jgi:hypothetical protein
MKNKLKVSNLNKFRIGKQIWWINNQFVNQLRITNNIFYFSEIFKGFSQIAFFFIFYLFIKKQFKLKKILLALTISYLYFFTKNTRSIASFLKRLSLKSRKNFYFESISLFRKQRKRLKEFYLIFPKSFVYNVKMIIWNNIIYFDIFLLTSLKMINLKWKKKLHLYYKQIKNYLLLFLIFRNFFEKIFTQQFKLPVFVSFYNQFFRVYFQKMWLAFNKMTKKSNLYLLKPKPIKLFFYLSFLAILENNMTLLAKWSSFLFQQGRYQQQTLRKIKMLLNIILNMGLSILGFKLVLYGKSKRNPKTAIKRLDFGHIHGIPLQNYTKKVFYGFAQAETFTGSFGFHIWMFRR